MPEGMRMMVPAQWEPLLHSQLLSWQAKHAFLREPKRAEELKATALLRRGEDADESVADFVIRHFGDEATRLFASPLLAGVFGGDIEKLSVRAVMAPFVQMEAETGSLIQAVRARTAESTAKPPTFTSLKSGMGTLVDRLVASLPPSSIRMHCAVGSISRGNGSWVVAGLHGEPQQFDAVIVATPAHVTGRLLNAMNDTVADAISALLPTEASSAICVALGFLPEKAARLRVPRGFGFLVPEAKAPIGRDGDQPLLAATFVDRKFPHRVPAAASLLRGFFGGLSAAALRNADDATLIALTQKQLSRYLGPLPPPDVAVVRHWPWSLPQYFVGHTQRMARLESLLSQLPGLRLIGSAYRGVGLPDLVRQARTAAKNCLSVRAGQAAR
jgi:oxygen-dependent protoporphyrinogen oxidase